MELKELTDRTLELFGVSEPSQLGPALLATCGDTDKLRQFRYLVDGDLSTDWMQKIYQYYLADRKEKKQDYTPASLAQFMGLLAGSSERIVDMCAGSGALIIQKWSQSPNTRFIALEIDDNVIPFLLFNLVLRNIRCRVFQMNAIQIRMNKTAAKRLGYDCMNADRPDLSTSFGVVGQKVEKEKFISFGADDGITIRISTKEGVHPLILDFLNHWKQMIMYLNNEENRYLAEFRDALLPELMSGRIQIELGEER